MHVPAGRYDSDVGNMAVEMSKGKVILGYGGIRLTAREYLKFMCTIILEERLHRGKM